VILRTSNAGQSWLLQTSGTTRDLSGVYFLDSQTGFAVGAAGTILRTTNSGAQWITASSGTTNWLEKVFFSDAMNGTIVGSTGTILRTTNGGVVWVAEEPPTALPRELTLSQNYPNPFNPTTEIRYSIVKQAFVSLKVFDLLGKEVATLVNEVKQPGTYEVQWEAAGVASGIYFYRIITADFIATKKMVVVK